MFSRTFLYLSLFFCVGFVFVLPGSASATPLTPPITILPGNGSSTSDTTPFFDWSSVSGAVQYNLVVREGSTSGPLKITVFTGTATSYTPTASEALTTGKTYWWRVAGCDTSFCTGTLGWSNWVSFTVTAADTTAPTITPIRVANDTTSPFSTTITNPDFGLRTNENATCRLGSSDIGYSSMVWSCSITGGTTHTCAPGITWSVGSHSIYAACRDSAGNENTSADNRRIDFEILAAALPAPTLASPAPGTSWTSAPSLIWNAVTDPGLDHYLVNVKRGTTSGIDIVTDNTTSTFWSDSSGKLTAGDTYWWRVASCANAFCTSPQWSSFRSFSISSGGSWSVTPSSLDFGSPAFAGSGVSVGTKNFTVENKTGSLITVNVAITGSGASAYTSTPSSFGVPAGSSSLAVISFKPLAGGNRYDANVEFSVSGFPTQIRPVTGKTTLPGSFSLGPVTASGTTTVVEALPATYQVQITTSPSGSPVTACGFAVDGTNQGGMTDSVSKQLISIDHCEPTEPSCTAEFTYTFPAGSGGSHTVSATCSDGSAQTSTTPITVIGSAGELCTGGIDEDGDGKIDCDDSDCAADAACVSAALCGNGTIDSGEGCDDSNTNAGDGCSASCQFEASTSCNNNGTRDAGEVCDGADLGGKTCSSFGLVDGTSQLKCISGCNFDPAGCQVPGGGTGPGGGTTLPPIVVTFPCPIQDCSLTSLVNKLINFLFTIAVIVAPILLVVAGIIFMTAAGDPSRVATARRMLLWTVIGFGVILISKGLIEVVRGILGIAT